MKKVLSTVGALIIALTLAMSTSGCMVRHQNIPPGYVGIQVNLTGQDRGTQGLTISTGRVAYNPYTTNVIEYPTFMQTVKWTASLDEGKPKDESVTFTSSDAMIINADVSLSYELDRDKVPDFYVKFRADNIESFTDGFLRNIVRDSLNDVAGKYTVEQLMSDNGPILKTVQAEVQSQVTQYGVKIDQFGFIGAPRPPEVVREAINSKVKATQDALRVQNEIASAEAQAKKRVAEAQGESDANKVLTSSINPALLEWKRLELEQQAINKWNGVRPQVEGSGTGMLLNVSPK